MSRQLRILVLAKLLIFSIHFFLSILNLKKKISRANSVTGTPMQIRKQILLMVHILTLISYQSSSLGY